MKADEDEFDRLLQRSMAGPIPSLPPDFDQRVTGGVRRGSQTLGRYRRNLLAGYGLVSVVVSAAVMRGQGLDWGVVSVTMLAPLALVAIVGSGRRAAHTRMDQDAGKT
jgi:hypothetical protein